MSRAAIIRHGEGFFVLVRGRLKVASILVLG